MSESNCRPWDPAFPVHYPALDPHPGMSLRDWLAGQAMRGCSWDVGPVGNTRERAYWCYEIADAMMEAREATMNRINQNELARRISEMEGKKRELDIAQIKECLRVTLILLGEQCMKNNSSGVLDLVERVYGGIDDPEDADAETSPE